MHQPAERCHQCIDRTAGGTAAIHIRRVQLGSRLHAVKSLALPDQQGCDGGSVSRRNRAIAASPGMDGRFAKYRMRGIDAGIQQAYARPGSRGPGRCRCGRGIPGRGGSFSVTGGLRTALDCTATAVDVVVVVASAGIGLAQHAQRLFRRHILRRFEYHQPNVHRVDDLLAIDEESARPGTIQRRIRRREPENFVAHDGIAVRIFIHDLAVCTNQAADGKMTQITQLIEGLRLYLIQRLRQALHR